MSPNRDVAWPVRSVRLGVMLMLIIPSLAICGVTLSTTPSVIACGSTVVWRIRPDTASVWVVVLKNTSCVPTRIMAGSLLSAFTVGLAITLTVPWLANALSRPVKSLMRRPTVNAPPAGLGDALRQRHASPARSMIRFQLMPAEKSSLSATSMTFAWICTCRDARFCTASRYS